MKPELSSAAVFPALGTGSNIKASLRSKHPVKNRYISKRDLDMLIHGILSTRDYQPVVLQLRHARPFFVACVACVRAL